ncbi:MAG: S-layer homology domain-containing protein [Bacillota bacterium]|nr:S-layer homology domain-containing protein [Bacillota bacterium]
MLQKKEMQMQKKIKKYVSVVLAIALLFGNFNIANLFAQKEEKVYEIPSVAYRFLTQDQPSMFSPALRPTALYKFRDGKHIYTIFTKPLTVEDLLEGFSEEEKEDFKDLEDAFSGGISLSSIEVDGKKILPEKVDGVHNQSFTFELDKRVERKTIKVQEQLFGVDQPVDIIFDFSAIKEELEKEEEEQKPDVPGDKDDEKEGFEDLAVKVFQTGTETPSKLDGFIKSPMLYKEKDGKHIYKFSIKPVMGKTVDSIEVNGKKIPAQEGEGEYSKTFTFELEQKLNKVTIKFFVKEMGNHSPSADLAFYYDGLPGGDQEQEPEKPENPGNEPQKPADEYNLEDGVQYRTTVELRNNDTGERSMGDSVFENNRSAYITREGAQYKIVITSNPIKIDILEAGIRKLVSHDDAILSILHENSKTGNLTYASKITFYVSKLKETYDIGIYAGPMKDTRAKLRFDLANRQKSKDIADANTNLVEGSAGSSGGGSDTPKKDEKKKEEIKENKVPLSEKKDQAMDAAKVNELVKEFTDVTENAWYREALAFVIDKKLFNGTSKTSFEPNKSMTRGMVVTVLHRLAEEKQAPKLNLSDVAGNMYYAKAFDWAISEGMIKGYADSTYRPENAITRAEFVSILYRFAKVEAGNEGSLDKFADKAEIAAWAKDAIAWAVEKGIVEGDNGNLKPNKEISRAEAASILKRFIDLQEKK